MVKSVLLPPFVIRTLVCDTGPQEPQRKFCVKGEGETPCLLTMFYTYVHFRKDDGRPFYVGKGFGNRYLRKTDRTFYWKNVEKKHGLDAKVMAYWPTEQEAFEHEKFLILCFKDLGYSLVNMTDGGEGASGWVPSESWRKAKSKSQQHIFLSGGNPMLNEASRKKKSETEKGKTRTKDHRQKISLGLKGNKNTLGQKLPEDQKRKISAALIGNKNSLGRKNTEESNKKRSEAMKAYRALVGKNHPSNSEETKAKRAASIREYHEAKHQLKLES